jgi:hypothetical protein
VKHELNPTNWSVDILVELARRRLHATRLVETEQPIGFPSVTFGNAFVVRRARERGPLDNTAQDENVWLVLKAASG